MGCWCELFLYSVPIVGIVLFLLSRWNFNYWNRKGLQGPKPTFIFGNVGRLILKKDSFGERFSDIYFQTKHLPYAGIFMLLRRTLLVNDLDLIKQIIVKDFEHFTDRRGKFSEEARPLSTNLFSLTGEKWKKLRVKLTPTFTSSKIRYMFDVVGQCSIQMLSYLEELELKNAPVDVKTLMSKFTTDVIGSSSFGMECDSFKHPDTEMRRMGRKLFEPGYVKSFILFVSFSMPELINFLGLSIFEQDLTDFFYNTVDETIKYREENNIVRNDFMQLLIQLKKDGYVADDDSGRYLNSAFGLIAII